MNIATQSIAPRANKDRFSSENAELAELLQCCAKGDRKAFERLYALTAPKLTAITLRMVRDDQLTFDILQQSYLSIWKNAASFDPEKGKAFTWMLVVTRNRSLDSLRKLKRQGVTEELTDVHEDDSAPSDDTTRAWMLRRLMAPYLEKLTPETTQAIILSVVHGLSSREIGERLNVPTNTVKSWVRRGLEKLRLDMGIDDIAELI